LTRHTADDDAVLDTPASAGVGDIKLVLQRARARDAPPKRKRFRDVPSAAQKIHERAKKGLVHQIQCVLPSSPPCAPRCELHLSSS
jgi:hypothetical protein